MGSGAKHRLGTHLQPSPGGVSRRAGLVEEHPRRRNPVPGLRWFPQRGKQGGDDHHMAIGVCFPQHIICARTVQRQKNRPPDLCLVKTPPVLCPFYGCPGGLWLSCCADPAPALLGVPPQAASSVGSVQWSPPVAGPEVGPHTDLRFSATPWRGALVLWTGAALHCYRPDHAVA